METFYQKTDWQNSPSTNSPINETNLNNIEDGIAELDKRVCDIDANKSNVDWVQLEQSGKKIAEITVDGVKKNVYAPNESGGEGGSSVEWNQLKKDGEKIAEITINGETTEVFAPEGGGASTWSEVAEKPFSTIGSGLTVENDVLIALGGGGSSIPWTYIKDIDLSGTNAVSIPEFANYDEFYIHSDTDFDILNQYFIKDVTQRINVGAFSSTTYYCLVLGTIDWINKTIKKDAYAHSGWSTSCKFKLYGRKLSTSGGGGGTSDYSELTNKPQINNVELSGNKTLEDLNIQEKITHDQPISDSYVFHDRTSVNNVISQMNSDITALKNDVQVLQITVGQANALLEEVLYGNS